jgi:hypothetical protein
MSYPTRFIVHRENGDSIASGQSFPEVLEAIAETVTGTPDLDHWTVTIAEGSSLRAMPFQRAMDDYLPEADRVALGEALEQRAVMHNALAEWLAAQPAPNPTPPPEPTPGDAAIFMPTKAGQDAGM